MPKRPKSHVVSDQAVSAVMDLVARAGYAAEVVSKDYGEDLLVQTSHAGRMDASRLWLQVKGTESIDRHRLRSGNLRLPVSFDHAIRWSRSGDLVAIVLWDVRSGTGWFAYPMAQVDPLEGFLSEQRSVTLQFDHRDVLSVEAVDALAWESRITHFQQLILNAKHVDSEREWRGEAKSKLVNLLALDFLTLLGIVGKVSEDPVLFDVAETTRERLAENFVAACEIEEDPEAALYRAVIATLFEYVPERNERRGLPKVLIEEPAETLISILGLPKLFRGSAN
jgi:hypothetical protein